MSIKSHFEKFNLIFTPALEDFFTQNEKRISRFLPIVQEVGDQIKKITLSKGKRIRPALLYYSYKSFAGKSFASIKNYCLAIEILHTWALIHDDIMDNSSLRRGQETAHKYFAKKYQSSTLGNSLAILAGDLAFSWADELFYTGVTKLLLPGVQLSNLFSDMKNEVIYGQILDTFKPKNETQVLKMMELKTGSYTVQKPLQIGAILAGANITQLDIIGKIGLKIGIAFQLQDDILGTFGDEKTLGKPIDSDLKEGKVTLLVIKTLQKLKLHDKSKFLSLWGNRRAKSKDLEEIRKMIKSSAGLESCLRYYNSLCTELKKEISLSPLPPFLNNFLTDLIDFNRKRIT